jgi:hypothetical protein
MRLPRVTIASAMALTVLAAVDCLVLREWWGEKNDDRLALFFFGGLPLFNILMAGLVVLAKRWRKGATHAFLSGFVAAGGAVLACYVAIIAAFPEEGADLLTRVCVPLNPLSVKLFPAGLAAAVSIVMAIATVPELALAILGGLLHRRYRVAIGRRRPEAVSVE